MKKILFNLCSTLFLLVSITAYAQVGDTKKYDFEKRKTYEKSYIISVTDKVNISNQFGFVNINIWDKNEIKVTVEIIASANKESRATDIVENIDISDKKNSEGVFFKTKIGNEKMWQRGNNYNNGQTMKINYTVYLPKNSPLHLSNEFGPITLPDYVGDIDVVSKFGSLTAGKLDKVNNLLVEFGAADVESINNADAIFKFSKISINNVAGNTDLKFEFCKASKVILNNNATSVTIDDSYSKLNIRPAADFNASYKINTSFGDVKNRSGLTLNRTDDEPEYGTDNSKAYEAKSGTGLCKVKIKSSFGNIILGEATAEDLKEKSKKNSSKNNEDESIDL
jgi:hypothetical protein